MEKTLKEHQADAARARWAKKSAEERAEYSKMMNDKKYASKRNGSAVGDTNSESTSAPN